MKKIITSMAVATLIIVSITACKKNDVSTQSPPAEIKFSAEALAWVQIPLNKYFIYKDSATGKLDSVVVTQSSLENKFRPKFVSTNYFTSSKAEYYYQTFTLLLTKYNGTSSQDWFYGEAITLSFSNPPQTNNDAPLALRERTRINNGNNYVFSDNNHVFYYPINPDSNNSTIIKVLLSITIEGKTYSNAVMTSIINGLEPTHPNYLKSTYYWVKGVGIIKREVRTGTSIKAETLVRNG